VALLETAGIACAAKVAAANAFEAMAFSLFGLKQKVIDEGAIPKVVQLLGDSQSEVRYAAASALETLCAKEDRCKDLAASAIGPLVQMLSENDATARAAAASALRQLVTEHPSNREAAAHVGALTPLLAMLGQKDAACFEIAAWTLANLVHGMPALKDSLLGSDVVADAVHLLRQDCSIDTKEALVWLLGNLADQHEGAQHAIGDQGAVEVFVSLLGDGPSSQVRKAAAWSLGKVCSDNTTNQWRAVNAGAFALLVSELDDPNSTGSEASAALECLCSDKSINEMHAASAVPVLLRFLHRADVSAFYREAAAWALIAIMENGNHVPLIRASTSIASDLHHLLVGNSSDGRLAATIALRMLGLEEQFARMLHEVGNADVAHATRQQDSDRPFRSANHRVDLECLPSNAPSADEPRAHSLHFACMRSLVADPLICSIGCQEACCVGAVGNSRSGRMRRLHGNGERSGCSCAGSRCQSWQHGTGDMRKCKVGQTASASAPCDVPTCECLCAVHVHRSGRAAFLLW
jgi:hypothetical protein